jgi:RimJ/RimL family protein N-acetyltransferase
MHTGFLSVYVKKEFRGFGIGKLLMNRLLKWGKQNKLIKKMSLAVFSNNENAIRLYEQLDFKVEGVCPKDIKINGRYYDSIFMYKFMK